MEKITLVGLFGFRLTIVLIFIGLATWLLPFIPAFFEKKSRHKEILKELERKDLTDRRREDYECQLKQLNIFTYYYWNCTPFWIFELVGTGLAGVCILVLCFNHLSTIHDIHVNEGVYYRSMQTEYNTLENIMDTTTDLVNQDVYTRVLEYNQAVNSIQERRHHPNWEWNFSGDYDWDSLELIKLKER